MKHRQDNLNKRPVFVVMPLPEETFVTYYKGCRFSFARGGFSYNGAVNYAKRNLSKGISSIISKQNDKGLWFVLTYVPPRTHEQKRQLEKIMKQERDFRRGKAKKPDEFDAVPFKQAKIEQQNWGTGLDEHIADAIRKWNDSGIKTYGSCEGHRYNRDGSVNEQPRGYIEWYSSPYDREIYNLAYQMLSSKDSLIGTPQKQGNIQGISYYMNRNFDKQKREWINFLYQVPYMINSLKDRKRFGEKYEYRRNRKV